MADYMRGFRWRAAMTFVAASFVVAWGVASTGRGYLEDTASAAHQWDPSLQG